ncbi:flavin reductase [Nocardia barduliensis]|uniref:flavin reductase n=1 Tax=Nocardia barduliensis TaxID=2736643 RepID=UPI00157351AE|nr:flavin reductase [Nocardia barduliensis]
MASVAAPVAVVTSIIGVRPAGATVSAFTSLSMTPPMVMVGVGRAARASPSPVGPPSPEEGIARTDRGRGRTSGRDRPVPNSPVLLKGTGAVEDGLSHLRRSANFDQPDPSAGVNPGRQHQR